MIELIAVKMRGVAAGEYLHQDFFFIMDRLFGTLDQRVNAWRALLKKNSGFCGFGKNKDIFHQVLKERMIVAYDLAVAFMYLHENRSVLASHPISFGRAVCLSHSHHLAVLIVPFRLVYRDIKPEVS